MTHSRIPLWTTLRTRRERLPARLIWPQLAIGASAFIVSLTQSFLLPLIPDLPKALDTSPDNVAWVFTSTLLVATAVVPVMGRLGDILGKKRLLLVALGSLIVGASIDAVAGNVWVVIVGRALQGVALAALPLGVSLMMVLLPPERRGSAAAFASAMLGVGGALGLPLGAVLMDLLGLAGLFWVTAAVTAAVFLAVSFLVPESPRQEGTRIDFLGIVLLSASLFLLVLCVAQGQAWGWNSRALVVALISALVLAALFVRWQMVVDSPFIDVRAIARRTVLCANIATALIGFTVFSVLIATASYLEAPRESGYGHGLSVQLGGSAMIPNGVAMLAIAPFAAKLIKQFGAALTMSMGAMTLAAGWLMRLGLSNTVLDILVATTILGLGTGMAFAAMPTLMATHFPPDQLGSANGVNMSFRMFGSTVAAALGGAILAHDQVTIGSARVPSVERYELLIAISGGCAVVAAVLAARARPALSPPLSHSHDLTNRPRR